MTLLRRIARPMLASVFLAGSYDAFQHPGPRAKVAEPFLEKMKDRLPVQADAEFYVRANAAVQMGAATLLAIGRMPRMSAAVLAVTLVPTTVAGHAFWTEEDPERRAQQRTHFLKNVSTLGGLFIAAADTAGKPSLAWRAQHAAQHTARNARHVARASRRELKLAAKAAH